jgi:prepilin-type N-terminal cleavage/methylation domain-containing protein
VIARRGGFTLVEIFVVLIILGIMAFVAAPAFRTPHEENDLTYSTHTIENLMKIARDSAVHMASPVTLVIDSATTRAWIVTSFPSGSADSTGEIHAADLVAGLQLGDPIPLPASVRVQLSKIRVRFTFGAGGSAFADSLVLKSAMGNRLITVDPWTGNVID